MGGVGYLRDLNVIRYCTHEIIPEINVLTDTVDIGVLMRESVPVIVQSIRNYAQMVTGEENTPFESCFFIALKDRCWSIFKDGSVDEITDADAYGSGAEAAKASLRTSVGEPPLDRLIKALDAAAHLNLYVSEPYVVIDTQDCVLRDIFFDDGEDVPESELAETEEE